MALDGDAHYHSILAGFCREYAHEKSRDLEDAAAKAVENCKSPIEKLMIAALCYVTTTGMFFGDLGQNEFRRDLENIALSDLLVLNIERCGIHIYPQVKILNYRADFVIRYADQNGGVAFAAIECDGHDHHNLTKAQAQHDRERDRAFQEQDLLVLRFTGSEIWKSPLKCALDALFIVGGRAHSDTAKRWR